MIRSLLLSCCLIISGSLTGCLTIGEGVTEREFNSGWASLETDLSSTQIEERFGSPREKRPDPDGIAGRVTWIYSRPEVIEHKTEIDEVTLNESGTKMPTYEQVEVVGVVEFHLHFQDAKLVNWQRIIPRSRSF